MDNSLYDNDFYGWTKQQAELLRAGKLAYSDVSNIAEEIEDMGKNLKRELENRLKILFIHLLKWQYQPTYRGNSWRYSIEEERAELADHINDNPSLKFKLPEAMQRGYKYAVSGAAKETGLSKTTFPDTCPWSFEQTMDNESFPE
ncbi:DUF29 domain-containing protein [Candidatus Thiosymbion oneisti]|uniref:DUF29 domain-containing protein n=1 Tax=Candidatus Thiosymbion oneisti TaxID=589554 RepID=UPI00105E4F39|nr:DUF29 domain-containing protein [Candidatus Thiosymbion oneisti]